MDMLASLQGKHGSMVSAHIWNNLAESDATEAKNDLLSWLRLCDKTGAKDLVIHGGSFADRKEGVARTRRVLESVLSEFERKHVVLNLENHYAYDYRNCRELFSEPWEFNEVLTLDSPSMKFCFDTGHGNMTDNTAELLGALAPWLNYVHLADNHGLDDNHAAYKQGSVAWEDVFARLRDISFNGVFCIEFPVLEDRKPFQACVQEIRNRWSDAERAANVGANISN